MIYPDFKALFKYDKKNGKLYWKVSRSFRIKIGQEAGTTRQGYRIVSVDHKLYRVHRVIWFLETGNFPINDIDHIDGNPSNNKISNLRDVTRSVNQKNQKMRNTNKSGFNGVSWDSTRKKWAVSITVDNKMLKFGRYDNLEEAIKVRKKVNIQFGFHKNHGR